MLKSVVIISAVFFCSVGLSGQEQDKAPPKELIQYVRDAQKAGQNAAQIQQNAVNAGWPQVTVDGAIAYLKATDKDKAQPEAEGKTPAPAGSAPAAAPQSPETPAGSGGPAPSGATKPPADSPAPAATSAGDKAAEPAKTEPVSKGAKSAAESSSPPAGATPAPPVAANVPDDYQIGAGDILKITVWHEPDASLQSAVVLPSGRISVPLLHEVEVAGLTVPKLEKLLTDRFSSLINSPEVSVIVTGMNSKKIYITGKVKKEGPLPLTYPMTVMQALSEAGGVTDYAKKKGIYVLRTESGKQFNLKFDYAAVLKGEHLETNIQLIPGDMIVVP